MELVGFNAVKTALDKNIKIDKVYLDFKKYPFLLKEFEAKKILFFPYEQYKNEKQEKDQKIVAFIKDLSLLSLDELIDKSYKTTKTPIFVLSDKITDPQNLGAIIRNAAAFGINGLILPKFNQAPITSTVVKTSAGTALFFDIALVSSLNNVLVKLKQRGFWIVDTQMTGKNTLEEIANLNLPLVIILGSEKHGVSKSLKEKSDFHLGIKISKEVESLNVASSSAIIFHYLSNLK